MAQISDLVRDSKLETFFLADGGVKTVHTFRESDPTSGRRLVTRQEHWQRQRRVGGGASGSVWIEKCTDCGRLGGPQGDAVRAVKQIDMKTSLRSIDYNRELEAIAKFSHTKVSIQELFDPSQPTTQRGRTLEAALSELCTN